MEALLSIGSRCSLKLANSLEFALMTAPGMAGVIQVHSRGPAQLKRRSYTPYCTVLEFQAHTFWQDIQWVDSLCAFTQRDTQVKLQALCWWMPLILISGGSNIFPRCPRTIVLQRADWR